MVACAPLTEGWYLLRMQNFCFVLVVIHGAVGSAAPKGLYLWPKQKHPVLSSVTFYNNTRF